jgi:hypothetical protein
MYTISFSSFSPVLAAHLLESVSESFRWPPGATLIQLVLVSLPSRYPFCFLFVYQRKIRCSTLSAMNFSQRNHRKIGIWYFEHNILQYFPFCFRVLLLAAHMQRISWNVSRIYTGDLLELTLTRSVQLLHRHCIFVSFSLCFQESQDPTSKVYNNCGNRSHQYFLCCVSVQMCLFLFCLFLCVWMWISHLISSKSTIFKVASFWNDDLKNLWANFNYKYLIMYFNNVAFCASTLRWICSQINYGL